MILLRDVVDRPRMLSQSSRSSARSSRLQMQSHFASRTSGSEARAVVLREVVFPKYKVYDASQSPGARPFDNLECRCF